MAEYHNAHNEYVLQIRSSNTVENQYHDSVLPLLLEVSNDCVVNVYWAITNFPTIRNVKCFFIQKKWSEWLIVHFVRKEPWSYQHFFTSNLV